MDFPFLSTLKGEKVKIVKVSYDVICRWWINFFRRMQNYADELQIPLERFILEYFIPKFHLPAHGLGCHTRFSFNYRPGVGRTHGENIESGWAHTNPAAISTREMGAGARHSTLDGHWGGRNWRKIIGFGKYTESVYPTTADVPIEGPLLMKNLQEALDMTVQCEDVCKDFEKCVSPETINEWAMMKRRWEIDPTQADPYVVVEKGKPLAHPASSILTLSFRSHKPRFCKTEACGDRSA